MLVNIKCEQAPPTTCDSACQEAFKNRQDASFQWHQYYSYSWANYQSLVADATAGLLYSQAVLNGGSYVWKVWEITLFDPSNPIGTAAALDNTGPQREILYPYGKGKIDLVFRFAKWAQSDVNIGNKYKVKDLGGNRLGLVIIPGGISKMLLDDRFEGRLNKDGMFNFMKSLFMRGYIEPIQLRRMFESHRIIRKFIKKLVIGRR